MSELNLQTITSNGIDYDFWVIKDLTEPCPECGVPACGKEDILWYESEEKKISLIIDGGILNLILGEYLKEGLNEIPYEKLPMFIRHWNEDIEWSDYWEYDGYNLDIDDFIKSLDLLYKYEISEQFQSDKLKYLNEMKSIALKSKKLNLDLKIVRG